MTRNQVIIQSIGLLAYTLIYMIFAINQNYRTDAYLFNTYYPVGILLGMALLLLAYRLIGWSGIKGYLIGAVSLVLMLVVVTGLVQNLYGSVLSHYYRNTTESLIGLHAYSKDEGNLIQVQNALQAEGLSTGDLMEGFPSGDGRMSYWSDGHFVTYNWNNDQVLLILSENEVRQEVIDGFTDQLSDGEQRTIQDIRQIGCTYTLRYDGGFTKVHVTPGKGLFEYIYED